MKCPKCQTELPDDARFCGMCGLKFTAGALEDAAAPREAKADPLRFFQDQTSETNAVRDQALLQVAQQALHTGEAAKGAVMAAVEVARGAEPSVDPVTREPFEFRPPELARALGRAAARENKPPPNIAPENVTHYYAAGTEAGMDRKVLEECLHQVALERVQALAKSSTSLSSSSLAPVTGPMTDEFEPIQPSKKKIAIIGGAVALGVVGLVVVLASGGEGAPVKAGASADGGAAVAAPDKPRAKAGEMDTSLVKQSLAAVGEKAKECHLAAQKKNPKVGGKIVFDVELLEDGSFSKLDVKEDLVKDEGLLVCVKDKIRAHAWPHPKGGVFAMEFPLEFQAVTQDAPAAGSGKKKGKKR